MKAFGSSVQNSDEDYSSGQIVPIRGAAPDEPASSG